MKLVITSYLQQAERVLLEKVTVYMLVKKSPTSYGTQRFINMLINHNNEIQERGSLDSEI
jgi:hypothetical protein